MKTITELAKIFAEYKIYPEKCYGEYSPVRVFQKMFPENYYSKDLEAFLSFQNYEPERRGADLPWWGREYFSAKPGFRVMVISQDTMAGDAGSIVLAVQFLSPEIGPEKYAQVYREYIKKMKVAEYFPPSRFKKVVDKFNEWGIDSDFLYITDASKVFKKFSWKNRDFDEDKSKNLLEAEIEICKPDMIILLGAQPLYLLDKNIVYADAVESGKVILIKGVKTVVAPFFIGNGLVGNRGGLGFEKRMEIATDLIKK